MSKLGGCSSIAFKFGAANHWELSKTHQHPLLGQFKHIEVLDTKRLPKIDTFTRLGFCASIGWSKHFQVVRCYLLFLAWIMMGHYKCVVWVEVKAQWSMITIGGRYCCHTCPIIIAHYNHPWNVLKFKVKFTYVCILLPSSKLFDL